MTWLSWFNATKAEARWKASTVARPQTPGSTILAPPLQPVSQVRRDRADADAQVSAGDRSMYVGRNAARRLTHWGATPLSATGEASTAVGSAGGGGGSGVGGAISGTPDVLPSTVVTVSETQPVTSPRAAT